MGKIQGIDANWQEDALFGLGLGIFFIILNFVDPIFAIGYPLVATDVVSQVLLILFVAGVGEEIIFRGAIMSYAGAVAKDDWKKVMAIAVSAIIFSIMHWRAYGVDLQTAFIGAGLFGVVAGIVSIQRKSIIPTIIMHVIFNAFLFGKSLYVFGT